MGKNQLINDAIKRRRQITDVCNYPFEFPRGDVTGRKYVLYDKYYCVFPVESSREDAVTDVKGREESILVEYTNWLSLGREKNPLDATLLESLRRENKMIHYHDTVVMFNNFFIANKFEYAGHVLTDDGDTGDSFVTLVYFRTQQVSGIVVDKFLFSLMESQRDALTHCRINDSWSGNVVQSVAVARAEIDTNIRKPIPLDKTLYATVSTPLRAAAFVGREHVYA